MPRLSDLPTLLAELRAAHLLRQPEAVDRRAALRARFGGRFLDASSNDYLGLGRDVPRATISLEPVELGRDAFGTAEHVSRETVRELVLGAPDPLNAVSRETLSGSGRPGNPSSPPEGVPSVVPSEIPTTLASVDAALSVPASGLPRTQRSLAPRAPARMASEPPNEPSTHGWGRISSLPPGALASRLVHGTHATHLDVEHAMAEWLDAPSALLFSSGYAANVGALGALLDARDLVVSDALNHASLIDGIRLSRARVVVVPHLDLDAVERALAAPSEGAKWVVAESYYSMDGDGPDLARLRALCDAAGAFLYLDEAHALGVFGAGGAGRAHEAGVRADVTMAAFGKAVGSHGAVVAGGEDVRTWLWNRARSFVFSTAPSPVHAGAVALQIERARGADVERAHLAELGGLFRRRLEDGGAPLVPGSFGPIVSLLLGAPERALTLAERAQAEGILLQAIRPPTVPEGHSRVRVTLSSTWSPSDVDRLATFLLEGIGA